MQLPPQCPPSTLVPADLTFLGPARNAEVSLQVNISYHRFGPLSSPNKTTALPLLLIQGFGQTQYDFPHEVRVPGGTGSLQRRLQGAPDAPVAATSAPSPATSSALPCVATLV